MATTEEFDPSAGSPFVGGQTSIESDIADRARNLVSPDSAAGTLTQERPRVSLTPPPAEVAQPVDTRQQGETSTTRNSLGTRAAATVAGLALAVGGGGVGAALGAENERAINDSKTEVAVTTIIPSAEYGDLAGPAEAAVGQLTELVGVEPGTISSETVLNEARDAMQDEIAATGTVDPGDKFVVSLTESTGGILTAGATHYDVDITSVNDSMVNKAQIPDPTLNSK